VKSKILSYVVLIVILTSSSCATIPNTDSYPAASNPISEIALLPYRFTKWFTKLLKPLGSIKTSNLQSDSIVGDKGYKPESGYWVKAN